MVAIEENNAPRDLSAAGVNKHLIFSRVLFNSSNRLRVRGYDLSDSGGQRHITIAYVNHHVQEVHRSRSVAVLISGGFNHFGYKSKAKDVPKWEIFLRYV
jgi:hypothetical protein